MNCKLHFEGSIADSFRQRLPQYSGIYLVYRGRFDSKENLFYCREIIYIGQASNIRGRINNHDRRNDFLAARGKDEVIFYSYAPLETSVLDIVEGALIFVMKPRLNNNGKDTYAYQPVHVMSDGACALLDTDFEIQ